MGEGNNDSWLICVPIDIRCCFFSVTDKDPHKWCTDIRTLEMMALETPCSRDFEMLATNPNCLY
jgi:hypothetical protein